MGAANLPRGAKVRVKLGEIDEITLDIMGTVLERLDTPLESGEDADAGAQDAANADEEGDDDAVAGPISIAVDMSETDAPASAGAEAASA
jgi:exoribonuclease-2